MGKSKAKGTDAAIVFQCGFGACSTNKQGDRLSVKLTEVDHAHKHALDMFAGKLLRLDLKAQLKGGDDDQQTMGDMADLEACCKAEVRGISIHPAGCGISLCIVADSWSGPNEPKQFVAKSGTMSALVLGDAKADDGDGGDDMFDKGDEE